MRPCLERFLMRRGWDWKRYEATLVVDGDPIVSQKELQTTYGTVISIGARWNIFARCITDCWKRSDWLPPLTCWHEMHSLDHLIISCRFKCRSKRSWLFIGSYSRPETKRAIALAANNYWMCFQDPSVQLWTCDSVQLVSKPWQMHSLPDSKDDLRINIKAWLMERSIRHYSIYY